MAKVRLSAKADDDLVEIYTYTFQQFGVAQADAYFTDLEDCLGRIADHPAMGQDVSHIRSGYRRVIHASHAIYYRLKGVDIYVVRILHAARDARRHL